MIELPPMTDHQRQVESLLRLQIEVEVRRLWRPAPTEKQVAEYSYRVSARCRRTAMACELGAVGWLWMLQSHLVRLRGCRVVPALDAVTEVAAA
jgi:hypothetical protein